MFPSDSQRAIVTTQFLRNYAWTRVFMVVDQASTWANSLAAGITDMSAKHGITLDSWWTPHLRDMSKLNATKKDLAAAAKHARALDYKVIVLAMSVNVEFAVRALLDAETFGQGVVILGLVDSYFTRTKNAFEGADRIVLDSSMVLVESGIDRESAHSIETMAEWPETTFLSNAAMRRTVYTLDGLRLFAYAIDATINRDQSPLVASELMSSLRTTSVQGLTGEVKIATNWNNIRSRCVCV